MAATEKIVCSKCQKAKRETDFFKMKTGDRCDMCKDCLTMHIDNRNPDTFMWILEKFNVPYLEREWVRLTNEKYMKDPANFGPKSVIGFYLRSMNMTQYKSFTFADTDKLNFEAQKAEREAIAKAEAAGRNDAFIEELTRRYEAGEISQAEYETLMPMTDEQIAEANVGPQFIQPIEVVDEEAIRKELGEEDYKYLALKWGYLYKPSEWVAMETLYQRYAAEYDITVDREETLKKICKTSLKMDQMLDVGDISGYKSLSGVFDQLRKSAKFTEAQNKEEQTRELDSIGELVAFVERESGIIPMYDDPIEYPQDKVDFTIKDMQNYVNRLVKEELGLTDIIESFIEKMEKQNVKTVEELMNDSFDDEADALSVEDVEEFSGFIASEIEEEARKLAEEFGVSEEVG